MGLRCRLIALDDYRKGSGQILTIPTMDLRAITTLLNIVAISLSSDIYCMILCGRSKYTLRHRHQLLFVHFMKGGNQLRQIVTATELFVYDIILCAVLTYQQYYLSRYFTYHGPVINKGISRHHYWMYNTWARKNTVLKLQPQHSNIIHLTQDKGDKIAYLYPYLCEVHHTSNLPLL